MLLVVVFCIADDGRACLDPRVATVFVEYSVVVGENLTFLDYLNKRKWEIFEGFDIIRLEV